MIGFIAAATLILAFAAIAARLFAGWNREAQRLVLLGGMVTTLLLPLGMQLVARCELPGAAAFAGLAGDQFATTADEPWFIVTTIWLAGAALMTVRLLWHGFLARRWKANSRRLRDDEVEFVGQTLALSRSDIARYFVVADAIETPMVLAGIPQTILLPRAWQEWPSSLKRSALRHEWRHVGSADAQWAVVGSALRVGLWFHPLVWWVCARWAEQCEHLADHAAAAGRPAADYAEELLALADGSRTGALAFATAFFPQTRSRLARRVRAVLGDSSLNRPCSRAVRAVVLLAFAVAGLSLAAAWAPRMKPTAADLETEAETRLQANPFPGDRP
ncbi:MAG: M56 family metallopeptidase [Chthoniobacter sp.]|nr:M56 family metallopeptidase [Chthoniobacter sp.]